jgi:hypothetical protein
MTYPDAVAGISHYNIQSLWRDVKSRWIDTCPDPRVFSELVDASHGPWRPGDQWDQVMHNIMDIMERIQIDTRSDFEIAMTRAIHEQSGSMGVMAFQTMSCFSVKYRTSPSTIRDVLDPHDYWNDKDIDPSMAACFFVRSLKSIIARRNHQCVHRDIFLSKDAPTSIAACMALRHAKDHGYEQDVMDMKPDIGSMVSDHMKRVFSRVKKVHMNDHQEYADIIVTGFSLHHHGLSSIGPIDIIKSISEHINREDDRMVFANSLRLIISKFGTHRDMDDWHRGCKQHLGMPESQEACIAAFDHVPHISALRLHAYSHMLFDDYIQHMANPVNPCMNYPMIPVSPCDPEVSDAMIRRTIRDISEHDLRTPLTGLSDRMSRIAHDHQAIIHTYGPFSLTAFMTPYWNDIMDRTSDDDLVSSLRPVCMISPHDSFMDTLTHHMHVDSESCIQGAGIFKHARISHLQRLVDACAHLHVHDDFIIRCSRIGIAPSAPEKEAACIDRYVSRKQSTDGFLATSSFIMRYPSLMSEAMLMALSQYKDNQGNGHLDMVRVSDDYLSNWLPSTLRTALGNSDGDSDITVPRLCRYDHGINGLYEYISAECRHQKSTKSMRKDRDLHALVLRSDLLHHESMHFRRRVLRHAMRSTLFPKSMQHAIIILAGESDTSHVGMPLMAVIQDVDELSIA